MTTPTTAVLQEYEHRWRSHDEARTSAARRSRRLSTSRGFTFLAGVASLVAVDAFEGAAEGWAIGGLLALTMAFVGQVVVHRRVRAEERWEEALAAVAKEGSLRVARRWADLDAALPLVERSQEGPAAGHPYAADLDLTGRASLLRLLGPVTSARGRRFLCSWLLAPGTPAVARERQRSVQDLSPHADLRARYTAHGRVDAPDAMGSWEAFLGWAEAEPVLRRRPMLRWASFMLPPILITAVVADAFFGAGPWWLLPAAIQIWIARTTARVVGPTFARVVSVAGAARALVPQLRLLDGTRWEAPELARLRDDLGHGADAAHHSVSGLLRFLDTVESRRNIVYATLAPVFLLELHLAFALERWQERHGKDVRAWLDAAGAWEALSALATLAHDHPEWVYPEVQESGEAVVLAGRALRHPLLHPDQSVGNDVQLGPPGTFMLVTGSNMSGKSTLLRSIGLNAVLAGAGAPVAAGALSLPCFRVFTCMRVDDSLEEGVSLFMAELLRIRTVVEAARSPDPEGRPVLYLLDEMLHGTNTAERRVAARGVLRHLLDAGAVGAVSTHDLALAESPDLVDTARSVHFREHIEGRGPDGRPRITFDYHLRPGVATTRNALKLLEAVGLSLPEDAIDRGGGEESPPEPVSGDVR